MIFEFFLLVILQGVIFGVGLFFSKTQFFINWHVRKFVHVTTGLVAALTPLFAAKETVVLYAAIAVPTLYIAHARGHISFISNDSENKDYGIWLFPLGVLASAILFWNESYIAFQFAMFMLAIPDALAGIVGNTFRSNKFRFLNQKSVAGSLAFFVSSAIGAGFVLGSSLVICAGVGMVLTIVEACSGDVLGDNLTVPIAAGLIASQLL